MFGWFSLAALLASRRKLASACGFSLRASGRTLKATVRSRTYKVQFIGFERGGGAFFEVFSAAAGEGFAALSMGWSLGDHGEAQAETKAALYRAALEAMGFEALVLGAMEDERGLVKAIETLIELGYEPGELYDDEDLDATLELCDTTSPYALTGAIFAHDRTTIVKMANKLRHAAGNFYINDKPTGAVVGQQPFGGSRASGTNDKAGSYLNLIRWTSQRTIKETFVPPMSYKYPFMEKE